MFTRLDNWFIGLLLFVCLMMLTSYKSLFTKLFIYYYITFIHPYGMIHAIPHSLYLSLSLSLSLFLHAYLCVMNVLLPTVPCKCHSVPVQRRKRAQGQSAKTWGQRGCASKAVKTTLYGRSLSNLLSQFNSYCMLKLEKTKELILKLSHTRGFVFMIPFLCVCVCVCVCVCGCVCVCVFWMKKRLMVKQGDV